MSLDKETVAKIAFLARIDVPHTQQQALAGELGSILDSFEQLSEVDTEGCQPLTTAADMRLPMRADQARSAGSAEKVLSNAPEREHDCYVVPKVVE